MRKNILSADDALEIVMHNAPGPFTLAARTIAAELIRHRSGMAEIAKGAGPFSRDPLEHADNCIDAMKAIANGCLDGTWEPEGGAQ